MSAAASSPTALAVVTAPGLEAITAAECAALGVPCVAAGDGVLEGTGDARALWRLNLGLRTASRVLVDAGSFDASTFADLERRAKRIPWEIWVAPGGAVRFRVTCRKSRLYHSGAVAQRLGDAVRRAVPSARVLEGGATDEDAAGDEAQLFVVRLHRDRVQLRADSSGALLHRRGWRQAVARAPMRESLAAALLAAAAWDPLTPLVNPMCGSGTLAIEAALRARRMAPGRDRRFAFERWPGADAAGWAAVRAAARAVEQAAAPAPILASDRDPGAVEAAVANAARAGVAADIRFAVQPLSAVVLPEPPGLVIVNPPYGVRVGEAGPLRDLYARLGQLVRRGGSGWRLALIGADRALEAQLRLPLEERFRTTNGGLAVRGLVGKVG